MTISIDNALTAALVQKLGERKDAALANPSSANLSALWSILAANRSLGVGVTISYPTTVPVASNVPTGYVLSKLLLKSNWEKFRSAYADALVVYEELPPAIKKLAMPDSEAFNLLTTTLRRGLEALNSRKITDAQLADLRTTYATARFYLKNVPISDAYLKSRLEKAVSDTGNALGVYGLWLTAQEAERERLEAAAAEAARKAAEEAAKAQYSFTFGPLPTEPVVPVEEPLPEPPAVPDTGSNKSLLLFAGAAIILFVLLRRK